MHYKMFASFCFYGHPMIPLHDNIPSRTFPFVNYTIIGLCSLMFLAQLAWSGEGSLIERLGMVPARVVNPDASIINVQRIPVQTPYGVQVVEQQEVLAPSAVAPWLTVLTCIFLHGGWMHIIGNMWFLHIFGDNVEDRLGHVGYVFFYLGCGIAASLCHLAIGPQSTVPTIGASGAIAGVMGAYFVLYPRALVVSILPIFFFIQILAIPAPIFLGIWFLLQFFQGTLSISSDGGAGVAWWAHIGGFVAGVAIAWSCKWLNTTAPPVEERRLNADHMGRRNRQWQR